MLHAATAEKASNTSPPVEFVDHAGKSWPVLRPEMVDISQLKDQSGNIREEYLFEVRVSGKKVPLAAAPCDCAIPNPDGSYTFLEKGDAMYLNLGEGI